jgi:hypothetical protein
MDSYPPGHKPGRPRLGLLDCCVLGREHECNRPWGPGGRGAGPRQRGAWRIQMLPARRTHPAAWPNLQHHRLHGARAAAQRGALRHQPIQLLRRAHDRPLQSADQLLELAGGHAAGRVILFCWTGGGAGKGVEDGGVHRRCQWKARVKAGRTPCGGGHARVAAATAASNTGLACGCARGGCLAANGTRRDGALRTMRARPSWRACRRLHTPARQMPPLFTGTPLLFERAMQPRRLLSLYPRSSYCVTDADERS